MGTEMIKRGLSARTSAFIFGLILCAALSRLLPGLPPNFSPLGAMGVFAGATLSLPLALVIPLVATWLSDAVLGFYEPLVMIFVYAGALASAMIGRVILARKMTLNRVGGAAFLGSCVFFVLSNVGTWLGGGLYPLTSEGLVACFIAAIPFFGNTLASNLIFCAALFGVNGLVNKMAQAQRTTANRKWQWVGAFLERRQAKGCDEL